MIRALVKFAEWKVAKEEILKRNNYWLMDNILENLARHPYLRAKVERDLLDYGILIAPAAEMPEDPVHTQQTVVILIQPETIKNEGSVRTFDGSGIHPELLEKVLNTWEASLRGEAKEFRHKHSIPQIMGMLADVTETPLAAQDMKETAKEAIAKTIPLLREWGIGMPPVLSSRLNHITASFIPVP
ncbi:MAG: hypothetical protein SFW62_07370 [Alphaproteobacteria bacterium]|nr:hypothetical protein [Alphaproteobacteria bacterium]